MKELEKKNTLYESIIHNLPIGIQVFDRNGVSYLVNHKQSELLGLPDLSVGIGKFNVLTDPYAVASGAAKIYQDVYKGKKHEHTYEYNLGIDENKWDTRKDTRIFDEKIIPLKNNQQDTEFVLAVLDDVTDKKRREAKQTDAEEALRKSNEHHKNFVNHSPDILYKFSNKRGALYWSVRVTDILGFSTDELTLDPKLWYNSIHPDDKVMVNDAIENYNKGEKYNIEYRIKTKTGNWVWLHDYFMFKENKGDEIIIEGHATDITKRKELEIELAEAKQRFDMAMEATKDGLWDWNMLTNEIYFSPNWKRMLGYESNELPNNFSVWEQLTHPEDVKKSWDLLNEHISGKHERFEIEFRMKHKKGNWIDILSRANAYFDDNGNAHRVVGTHVDIRKQKQLEKQLIAEKVKANNYADEITAINEELNQSNQEYLALNEELKQTNETLHHTNIKLEESEIKFKTVFDILDVGLTITDEQGNIIDCNKASEKILGITKEEHLARNFAGKEWDIVRPDLSPMPVNEFASVRALKESKAILNIEMGILKPEEITWISANATPIHLKGYGVLVAFIDITDRKKSEQERILFNRNFEAFLNQTSDFVYFKDNESRFVFCSQPLAEITGHKHWKEMIGKHDLEVFPTDTAKIYYEEELPVFKEGIPLLEKTDPYYDKNGNKRFVLTNKWPLFDDNKQIVGIFGISRDITDRLEAEQKIKKSEKQLKELNATKDKFFSIIAHDLRNPFNALIGMNDLVSKKIDADDIETAKEILEHINNSSNQALNLLNNLLQWSRIQTGNLEFQPSHFDFEKSLGNVLALLEVNYKKKDISLKVTIEPYLQVYADKFMIETIMRNLISNAIKFTKKGGKIEVIAIKPGNRLEVSVQDSGIGISESKINMLFSIENNITSYGTENEKGSGLGLILCKEFIEKHNGKIWVESKENKGTRFTFKIKQ
ncbi:MAG: PAS domain S-box protein [Candidatus Delongbacteria bacterium]|nr:PAS domain S-box protein [Candidatus Delongbacteria bacterium]